MPQQKTETHIEPILEEVENRISSGVTRIPSLWQGRSNDASITSGDIVLVHSEDQPGHSGRWLKWRTPSKGEMGKSEEPQSGYQ